MKGLRITFLLPAPGHSPTGGAKVVYEYANHLSRRGHQVSLVHPAIHPAASSVGQVARGTASFAVRCLTRGFHPRSWCPLDATVRALWVPTLSSKFVPDGDVVIATAWETAEWLTSYPYSKGEKYYLIQSWETWSGPEERVKSTWLSPVKRIVIARWLRDLATDLGVECRYIPNGVDPEKFGLDIPIEHRDPNRMMMLYHPHPVKGSADGLDALTLVRQQVPQLRLTLFGTPPAPALPPWVEYHRLPRQRALRACYNQAAVFIAPGRIEGWPLPPAEAMMCGAAVAATDIGGHHEYAVHEETSLLSPPRQPEKLAANILRLVYSSELRISIARRAHSNIQAYSWVRATDSLESVLDNYNKSEVTQLICEPIKA